MNIQWIFNINKFDINKIFNEKNHMFSILNTKTSRYDNKYMGVESWDELFLKQEKEVLNEKQIN